MFSCLPVSFCSQGGVYPSMYWGRWPPGQTPPADTSLPSACWDTPPPTATATGGTHPTGMHTCFTFKVAFEVKELIIWRFHEIYDPISSVHYIRHSHGQPPGFQGRGKGGCKNLLKIENYKKNPDSSELVVITVSVFQKQNIYTIPNFLTMSRICMSPLLGYLVVQEAFPLACGLFFAAGLTDLVC